MRTRESASDDRVHRLMCIGRERVGTHTSSVLCALQDAVSSDDLAGFVYIDLRELPANTQQDGWHDLIMRRSLAKTKKHLNVDKSHAQLNLIIYKEVTDPDASMSVGSPIDQAVYKIGSYHKATCGSKGLQESSARSGAELA